MQGNNNELLVRTIKKFPISPIRPAGQVLPLVKHQICSPSCWSRLYEHLSFNMIENLLCFSFYFPLFMILLCDILIRAAFRVLLCAFFLVYVRLKTTYAAIKLRKRLLTISKISRLLGVYFKMNREARISLRAFFLQPKA